MKKANMKMMVWVVRYDGFDDDGIWLASTPEKAVRMVQAIYNEADDYIDYEKVLSEVQERDAESFGYSYIDENKGITIMKLPIDDFTL